MARPRKGKIKIKQKVGLRKKSEAPADNTRVEKAKARVYPENAAHIKVSIRKK